MMNNMYAINFKEAAKVMPKRIDIATKPFTTRNELKVHFALELSKDGEALVLTMRFCDRFGKYTTINIDPRRDKPFYSAKGKISKEIVDRGIECCLDKLAERFPANRQLTVFDMLEKEEDLPIPAARSYSNQTLDDLIEELVAQGYSYEDACDKAEAEFE